MDWLARMKYVSPPHGLVLFADDIRQEVGNKYSLIGLYAEEMVLAPGTVFPALLPKLGVAIRWTEPLKEFARSLVFKAVLCKFDTEPESEDGQTLAEFSVDLTEFLKKSPSPRATGIRIDPTFVLPPFAIAEASRLRVSVYRDGERWAIGRLLIPAPAPAPTEAKAAAA